MQILVPSSLLNGTSKVPDGRVFDSRSGERCGDMEHESPPRQNSITPIHKGARTFKDFDMTQSLSDNLIGSTA